MPKKIASSAAPKKVRAAKSSKTRAAAAPKAELSVPAPAAAKKKSARPSAKKRKPVVSRPVSVPKPAPVRASSTVRIPWLLMLTLSSALLFMSLILAAVKLVSLERQQEIFDNENAASQRQILPPTTTPFATTLDKGASNIDVRVVSPALNLTVSGATPLAAQGQLVTKQWHLRQETKLEGDTQIVNLGVANSWSKVPPFKRNDLSVRLNDRLSSKLSLQSTAARVTIDGRHNRLEEAVLRSSWLELDGYWGDTASSSQASIEAENGRVHLNLPTSIGVRLTLHKTGSETPVANPELSLDVPNFAPASTSTVGVLVSDNYDAVSKHLDLDVAIDSGSLQLSWYDANPLPPVPVSMKKPAVNDKR